MRPGPCRSGDQWVKGFVLPAVLWTILILALVASYQLRDAQMALSHLRNASEAERMRDAATSAMEAVLGGLAENANAEADGEVEGWGWGTLTAQGLAERVAEDFPDLLIHVRVQAEDSKVAISDREGAARLLESLGMTRLQAQDSAERLADYAEKSVPEAEEEFPRQWRLMASLPSLRLFDIHGRDLNWNGTVEDWEAYRWAEREGTGQPSPFEAILAKAPGGLAEHLTLMTESGGDEGAALPNPNLASAQRLALVPGLNETAGEQILTLRRGADGIQGTEDDVLLEKAEDLGSISAISGFREVGLDRVAANVSFTSDLYRIGVCVEVPRTHRLYRIEALARRVDEGGVRVEYWMEDRGL